MRAVFMFVFMSMVAGMLVTFGAVGNAQENNRAATSITKPKAVIELFTSQGCSSCPPADALLRKYVAGNDIIALSVAVDYWDRLGWKDTFGSAENTERQRSYARARGDGEVYTPQVVINGRVHAVGSDGRKIESALQRMQSGFLRDRIAMTAKVRNNDVIIHLGNARTHQGALKANINLALVQSKGTVDIKHGENRGRKINYHNIVRKFKTVGTWDGQAKSLRLSRKELTRDCCNSVVVLLQAANAGPVMSALQFSLN